MVGDAALFDDLESGRAWSPTDPATTARAGDRRDRPGDPAGLASLVSRAVAVKAGVVGRDPREHGERAVLNLGHTFAHAIEAATGHHITHGRAVAVGLVAACRLAERGVGAPSTLAQRVEAVVTGCGLPTSVDADPDAILAAMTADKKRRGGRPRFVLPTEIGQVVLTDDVSEADIVASIRSVTRAAQPA
jgi:3-dehydroquinate synthetase